MLLCLECRRNNANAKLFSDIASLNFLKLCKHCKSKIRNEKWFMNRQLELLIKDNEITTSYTVHE